MKIIRILGTITLFILLISMVLPEKVPVSVRVLKKNIAFTISPLSIHRNIAGVQIDKDFVTKLGLDLQGGSSLIFEADTTKLVAADIQDSVNSARDIIEKRVNLFGVSEPVVQTVKTGSIYRITVDLPGINNVSQAVSLIGQTAQLQFTEEATDSAKIASDSSIFSQLTKPSGLTGKEVKKAQVVYNSQTGKPEVQLAFTPEGAKMFAAVTERNVGKPLGIMIDQMLISAPTVQQKIDSDTAVISGSFSLEEAKQLAISINSGALPLPITLVSQKNIGPSLGASEIHKSVVAGMVGLGLVMLFMLLIYSRMGIIACISLSLYGALSFALFRAIPIVLTLPGIAGFLLSVGMAVDSNILIFERIKEELRRGKPLPIAVRVGFGRALDAIKDANVTTLIVAFILFNPFNADFLPQFGLVRGFALTLAVGVAMSLFTGVVITKRLIQFFYRV